MGIFSITVFLLGFSHHISLLLICHVSYQETASELTLNHLLHCAYNLFKACNAKKSGNFPSASLDASNIPPEFSTDSKECQTGMFNLPTKCKLHLSCGFILLFSKGGH